MLLEVLLKKTFPITAATITGLTGVSELVSDELPTVETIVMYQDSNLCSETLTLSDGFTPNASELSLSTCPTPSAMPRGVRILVIDA